MARGQCEWIKIDDKRCTRKAVEGFALCGGPAGHLTVQQRIAKQSIVNAKHLAMVGKRPSEAGAPTVLEKITEDGVKSRVMDQLSIINESEFPDKRFLRSRNNKTSIARHEGQGYRLLQVPRDGDNKPIVGQGSVVREGCEHQVDKDGHIVIGDLIFMEIDRGKRDSMREDNNSVSRERVERILSTGDRKKTDAAIGNHPGIRGISQRGQMDFDEPLPPPPTPTKKSFVIENNPLA